MDDKIEKLPEREIGMTLCVTAWLVSGAAMVTAIVNASVGQIGAAAIFAFLNLLMSGWLLAGAFDARNAIPPDALKRLGNPIPPDAVDVRWLGEIHDAVRGTPMFLTASEDRKLIERSVSHFRLSLLIDSAKAARGRRVDPGLGR